MARTMQQYVDHFERVPVLILPCLVRYRDPTPTEGASIYPACQNLLLAARALGYGGAFTGWHVAVEAELRELLGIPDGIFMAGTITVGKPAGHHGPVRRRPMAELVYEESWGARAGLGGRPARNAIHGRRSAEARRSAADLVQRGRALEHPEGLLAVPPVAHAGLLQRRGSRASPA